MTGGKNLFQRGLALMLALLCFAGVLGASSIPSLALVESRYNSKSLVRTSLAEIENVLTSTTYTDYRQINAGAVMANDVINVDFRKDIDPETTTATFNLLSPTASKEELARYDMPEKGSENTKSRSFFLPEDAGDILFVGDDGMISFRISVKEAGYYNFEVSYYTGNVPVYAVSRDDNGHVVMNNGVPQTDYSNIVSVGNYAAMERYVLIDGKVPYREARSVEFNRIWCDYYENKSYFSDEDAFIEFAIASGDKTDSERPFRKDGNGNELKPEKRLVSAWVSEFVHDSTGYFTDPLQFYLSEGEHIVSLQTVRETMAMNGFRICNANSDALPDYKTYYESHGGDSAVYHGDQVVYVQTEYATATSERTIYQLNNRSSVYTQPNDPALIRLNEIGGEKWEYVGQWIEWQCDIPESGFYSVIPRWMQAFYSGIYVSRCLYVDGEIPFAEAYNLRFDYTTDWMTTPLSDGSTDFLIYFEKGRHTIRMEAVLGDMSTVLNRVNNSLSNINAYYRKILMITGSDPDEYRDYNFVRLIPDVLSGLKTEAANLYAVSDLLTEMTGKKGTHAATLDRVANVCERMGKYPSTIAGYMDTLKSYTSSLGTWLADTQNQPLEIDYFCIQSPDKNPPKAEPGFFANLWGGIKKFWMSFFSDYDSLGSKEDGSQVSDPKYGVEVWTVTSRDQAQIVRNLVDDSFSPKYGIPITVKLVAGGTLLPATLAGTGPDVYMGAGAGDAVNYALRSAVLSLNTKTNDTGIGYNFNDFSRWADDPLYGPLIAENKIPTFDEVKTRFAATAMRPMTLYGETYGLPETMSFSMLFYRKDIFAELGLSVPDTWEEFYNIIYTLQAEELELGYPTG
ncbi:MAG: extracellular solute-binding protein, partial [Clostridia bacterium]|nr:extracellular solute-binding protein [Clostridia bacterium]